MASEQEQSLQRRPNLVPEKLLRGGLIVGVEQGIQGSLMSVTGAAIERITRERTEVPPQFKLPERPVYFLDPNTRRLIMISNRENRGENKTPDKYGLFAEIVELDEEGKPHYRLSTSEIILPDDNYHLVAVGPNNYGLPPSHIEVVEEEEGGKKKFVPWNLYLGQLQLWMNDLHVDPDEDVEAYIKRYTSLKKERAAQSEQIIKRVFRSGYQGFDKDIVPVNLIICDDNMNDVLYEISSQAGFYPLLVSVNELHDAILLNKGDEDILDPYALDKVLGKRMPPFCTPALITAEIHYLQNELMLKKDLPFKEQIGMLGIPNMFQVTSPVFSIIDIDDRPEGELLMYSSEPRKISNGAYALTYKSSIESDRMYLDLLNKLKADLLLTMFLRGGAPLTK